MSSLPVVAPRATACSMLLLPPSRTMPAPTTRRMRKALSSSTPCACVSPRRTAANCPDVTAGACPASACSELHLPRFCRGVLSGQYTWEAEVTMRILHTMIRVGDLQKSIDFYTSVLGMKLLRQKDYPDGRFTLAFVGYQDEADGAVLELTHNWDTPSYDLGNGYGHVA